MHQTLYIFNPEHDLALANNSPHFEAPNSAKQFAEDLASLPVWYAEPQSFIVCNKLSNNIIETDIKVFSNADNIARIILWGWDNAICKRLKLLGIDEKLLPSETQLNTLRELQHRSWTAKIAEYLQQHISAQMAEPARVLKTIDEVQNFVNKHHDIVLKAPLSGSGKGLYWCKDSISESVAGWCRHAIEKQGCVMGELAYDKVQDFAMEFQSDGRQVTFAGYSLFSTTTSGIYQSNQLLSDAKIEKIVSKYIGDDLLQHIQKQLINFFNLYLTPHYKGYFGVDMFVYQENGQYRVNPIVEVNLRLTMGLVARLLYDQHIAPDSEGEFRIVHCVERGELLALHQQLQERYPLQIAKNRFKSGYLSLCPITADTHYAAQVLLH